MHRLRSVDVMSAAKVSAVIYAAMALIMVPFFLIAALVGAFSASGASSTYGLGLGLGLGLLFVLLTPVLYALIGFISGAIGAALYNFAAGRFGGGVVVDLEAIAPPVLLPGNLAQ